MPARQDIFLGGLDRRFMLSIVGIKLVEGEGQTTSVVIADPNQRVEIERCDGRTLYYGRYATNNDVLNLVFIEKLEYLAKAGIHCAAAMRGRIRFLTPVQKGAARELAWQTTQAASDRVRHWKLIGRAFYASRDCITWGMARGVQDARVPQCAEMHVSGPDRISGRYAARLSSRCALLGANAALRAARFEPVGRRK